MYIMSVCLPFLKVDWLDQQEPVLILAQFDRIGKKQPTNQADVISFN